MKSLNFLAVGTKSILSSDNIDKKYADYQEMFSLVNQYLDEDKQGLSHQYNQLQEIFKDTPNRARESCNELLSLQFIKNLEHNTINIPTIDNPLFDMPTLSFYTREKKDFYNEFLFFRNSMKNEFDKELHPIQVGYLTPEQNQRLNNLYARMSGYSEEGLLNYKMLVRENYADIGAAALLLKTYGKDSNLQFVLNNIFKQRSDFYDLGKKEKFVNEFFTHYGLDQILHSEENLLQLNSINDNQQFLNFIKELSNKGAIKAIVDTSEISYDNAFNKKMVDKKVADVVAEMVGTTPKENPDMIGKAASLIIKKLDLTKIKFTDEDGEPLPYEDQLESMKELNKQIVSLKKEDKEVSGVFEEMENTLELFKDKTLSNYNKQFIYNDLNKLKIAEKIDQIKDALEEENALHKRYVI